MVGDPDTSLSSGIPEQRDDAQAHGRVVHTQGGDYAEGSIDKRQGTFVEGNLVITEEQSYRVAGLPNPYLGLRAYTADERDIFAGRERIVRALVERLRADDGDRLLFIVGASGSGKSSLARAGLLPDLADQLNREGDEVQTHSINYPGRLPGSTLLPLLRDISATPGTSARCWHLVLIDQFEELFSQADSVERDQVLQLLADAATSARHSIRIIATMRSDFLPHLVADARFESVEQHKVVIRAMTEEELRDAIQRPVQVRYPDKRFEPALIERLARDAAADVAYLPLLQVTLEDLWRGGELRLGCYHGLVDAIQRRADDVYTYGDYDGLRAIKRPLEEQQLILNLFLDLVRVSLDDEQRDVRWRRARAELVQGDLRREQALTDLVGARLLRTDRELLQEDSNEQEIETVDIVHEALLTNWPTLKATIDAQRELLRQRVRFDLALTEWHDNNRDDAYLLTGVRLAEAEGLKLQNDVTMHQISAQTFVDVSVKRRDSARQRQLRRTRFVAALFCILAAIALVAAWIAVDRQRMSAASQSQSATSAAVAQSNASTAEAERQRADQQTEQVSRQARLARASELAGEARLSAASSQQSSALLAVAALQQLLPEDPLPATVDQAIYETAGRVSERWFQVGSVPMAAMALSIDATTLVTLDQTGFGQVWDLSALPDTQLSSWATPAQSFQLAVSDTPSSFRFRMQLSRDGSWLVTSDEQWRVQLWDLQNSAAQMVPLATLPSGAEARPYALSADGSTLAAVYRNNTIAIWRLIHGQPIAEPQILPYVYGQNDVWLRLSADGTVIVAVDSTGQVTMWDSNRGDPRTFRAEGDLSTIVLSEDGSRLILWYKTRDAAVWDLRDADPMQTAQSVPQSAGTYTPQVAATSDDGIYIGALTTNRSVVVWNVSPLVDRSPTTFKTWTEQSDYVRLQFTDYGESLIGATYDGMIHRWGVEPQGPNDTTEDQLQSVLLGHTDPLLLLAVSEDGERLVSGDQSGLVRVWNLGAPLLHQPGFMLQPTSERSTFTVDDSEQVVLIDVAEDGVLHYRDPQQPDREIAPPQQLSTRPDAIDVLAVNNRAVALLQSTGALWVQVDETARFVTDLPYFLYNITLTSDARVIAAMSDTGGYSPLCIWVESTYRCSELEGAWLAALNVDGSLIALGNADNVIVRQLAVDGAATTRFAFDLPGGFTGLSALAMSADGRRLAAVTSDELFVWHLDDPNPALTVRRLRGNFADRVGLYLTENTQTITHRAIDGSLAVWNIEARSLERVICHTVTANLAFTEWQQYFPDEPYRRICPNLPDGVGVSANEPRAFSYWSRWALIAVSRSSWFKSSTLPFTA